MFAGYVDSYTEGGRFARCALFKIHFGAGGGESLAHTELYISLVRASCTALVVTMDTTHV